MDYSDSEQTTASWIDNFIWMSDEDFMDQVIIELKSKPQFPEEQITTPPPPPPPPQVSAGVVKNRKGVWSDEEHRAFMEGQKVFPNDWKKISAYYVPTRTNNQIASHHQKFMMNLAATGRKRGRKPSKKQ